MRPRQTVVSVTAVAVGVARTALYSGQGAPLEVVAPLPLPRAARPPPLGPLSVLVALGCLCFAVLLGQPGPPHAASAVIVADVWPLPCEAVTVTGPGVPSPPPRQLETRSFICIYMISLCSLRDGEIYLLLSLMFDYTRRRRRAAKCTDASLGARSPEGPVTQQRV